MMSEVNSLPCSVLLGLQAYYAHVRVSERAHPLYHPCCLQRSRLVMMVPPQCLSPFDKVLTNNMKNEATLFIVSKWRYELFESDADNCRTYSIACFHRLISTKVPKLKILLESQLLSFILWHAPTSEYPKHSKANVLQQSYAHNTNSIYGATRHSFYIDKSIPTSGKTCVLF